MNAATTIATAAGVAAADKIVSTVVKKMSGTGKKKNNQRKSQSIRKGSIPAQKKKVNRGPIKIQRGNLPANYKPDYAGNRLYHVERPIKRRTTNKFGGSVTSGGTNCKGRVLLAGFTPSSNVQDLSYTRVYATTLNPLAFPNTKLSAIAAQYTRFKFNRVALVWLSASSSTYQGNLTSYVIRDPEMRLAGQESTVAYADSLMQLPDTRTYNVWESCTSSFSFPNDGSSFFVAPDVQGEARFTTQGELGVFTLVPPGGGAGTYGHWMMEYDCDLWEDCYQALSFTSSIQIPAWQVTNYTNQTIYDSRGGSVYVLFNTNTETAYSGLLAGTVYQIIPSYNLGYMKAWQIYYVKTPSPLPPTSASYAANLYKTLYDATQQTQENLVPGSNVYTDRPPTEGFSYWTPANAQEDGFVAQKSPVIKRIVKSDSQDFEDLSDDIRRTLELRDKIVSPSVKSATVSRNVTPTRR